MPSDDATVSGVTDAEVATVTCDTLVELVFGQIVQKLGENGASFIHKVKTRWLAVKHL